MKGLLVKDFKLMKGQKNFYFIMIAVAVIMALFFDNPSFMIGFLSFVMSLFTLSTISYDEFDNGNAFLFTLPVSRTNYTVEKYCLALLLGGGAWVLSTILATVSAVIKETAAVSDIAMTAVTIIPVLVVVQAVMIPFQLKFGGDKARIALIVAFGLLFVVGIMIVKAAEMFGINIAGIIDDLPLVRMGVIVTVLIATAAILLLVSMKISIAIMKKKEF